LRDDFIEDDGFFKTGCSQCNWVESYGNKWIRCRSNSYFAEFCDEHENYIEFMENKRCRLESDGQRFSDYPFGWAKGDWSDDEPTRWKDTFKYIYKNYRYTYRGESYF
jgi:hypothetical protein